MKIRLKGITGHGKNRIREHGDVWEILTLQDIGIISSTAHGNSTPIRSIATNEWRWLDEKNFEIIENNC
jgi:hypothetical protein|tara:strand:+ start:353 stop:559 length:207 start_codon:yes stop_codon:yes gene_type:complete